MLIPALTLEEYEQPESNILSDGEIFNPIFTWNGYIIDGHHRYHILLEHPELKYKIVEKEFSSRFEVLSWICNNQLGRRNLTPENKKYQYFYLTDLNSENHPVRVCSYPLRKNQNIRKT